MTCDNKKPKLILNPLDYLSRKARYYPWERVVVPSNAFTVHRCVSVEFDYLHQKYLDLTGVIHPVNLIRTSPALYYPTIEVYHISKDKKYMSVYYNLHGYGQTTITRSNDDVYNCTLYYGKTTEGQVFIAECHNLFQEETIVVNFKEKMNYRYSGKRHDSEWLSACVARLKNSIGDYRVSSDGHCYYPFNEWRKPIINRSVNMLKAPCTTQDVHRYVLSVEDGTWKRSIMDGAVMK